MKKIELNKIIMTAILVTVAIVIDFIITYIPVLNLSMPFGGKFFGISMIPLILIGLIFGLRYGLIGGFLYALYNFSFDYLIYLSTLKATLESWTGETWGFWHIVALIFLDYIIPFTAFGLSGLFNKNSIENIKSILYSILLVSFTRLISSSLGGYLLWGSSIKAAASNNEENIATSIFKFVNNNLFLYSLIYNLIYITTTAIVTFVILISVRKNLNLIIERNISSTNQ